MELIIEAHVKALHSQECLRAIVTEQIECNGSLNQVRDFMTLHLHIRGYNNLIIFKLTSNRL